MGSHSIAINIEGRSSTDGTEKGDRRRKELALFMFFDDCYIL